MKPLPEGGALLRVADRGPGIPSHERGRIFEPFFRGEAARALGEDGVGLGLALVDRIARHHGGDVCLSPISEGGASLKSDSRSRRNPEQHSRPRLMRVTKKGEG